MVGRGKKKGGNGEAKIGCVLRVRLRRQKISICGGKRGGNGEYKERKCEKRRENKQKM